MAGFTGSLGSLWVEIGAKITKFESAMADVSKQIDTTISDADKKFAGFNQLGSKLTGVGTALTIGITAPVLAIGTAALKASGEFDTAMRLVSARGDIAGKDLDRLKAQAEELGAKTQFSSKQAAEGMAELAGAGFKTQQIYDSMPGIMNLAAAATVSVGDAAKITKDLLGQFGLQVSDTADTVDIVTKAANLSSGTLSEMANSLKYVGPPAVAAGMSLRDTAAALVALDKAGIRGEQAGTMLRSMLLSLQGPTDKAKELMKEYGIVVTDTAGSLKPLPQILASFQEGLSKIPGTADQAAAMTKIFGENAVTGAQALLRLGVPALVGFRGELTNVAGESKRTAETMNSGMGGALERLEGSITTAAQKLGDAFAPSVITLAGYVESAANQLAIFAGWFAKIPGPIQEVALALIAFAAAGGPVLILVGQLASSISSISLALPIMATALKATGAGLVTFTAALTAFNIVLAAGIAGLALLIKGMYDMWSAEQDARSATEQTNKALVKTEAYLKSQGAAVDELKTKLKDGSITQLQYEQGLRSMGVEIGKTKKATADHNKALTEAEKLAKQTADALKRAAGAQKESGEQWSFVANKVKTFSETGSVASRVINKLIADQEEAKQKLVEWKIAHQTVDSQMVKLTGTTRELDEAIQKMVSSAKLVAPAFLDAGEQATISLEAAAEPIRKLDEAYRKLGITSTETLKRQAAETASAYDQIVSDVDASLRDVDAAWVKMEEARIAAAKAQGKEIPKATQEALDAVKAKTESHTKETKDSWSNWSKQVSTIVTDLGKDIVGILWEGGSSWGEKGKAILSSLGQAVQRAFVEPAMKAIGDLMEGAIKDLLGGKGFGGILDSVKKVGSAIGDVFGGASGTAIPPIPSSVPDIPTTVPPTTPSTPSTPTVPGGGGGFGSLLSMVGSFAQVASAITGFIGVFQSAHQETSLNAIEHNTRFAMMFLGERGDGGIVAATQTTAEKVGYLNASLDDVNTKLNSWLEPLSFQVGQVQEQMRFAQGRFDEISSNTAYSVLYSQSQTTLLSQMLTELRTMAGRQPVINVYVDGQRQQARTDSLKLQGVVSI